MKRARYSDGISFPISGPFFFVAIISMNVYGQSFLRVAQLMLPLFSPPQAAKGYLGIIPF